MLAETVSGCSCVSIIGMCKNAGKTTALGTLIRELQDEGKALALTSVGRDGESTDVVTGTSKPRIFVRSGAVVVTAEKLLPLCDVSRRIEDATDISTPLGRIILLRAMSDGYVQLAGPSIVAQLTALSHRLTELNCDMLIVDGALGRRSTASTALADAVLLSTGASLGRDMTAVALETAYICRLFGLPGADGAAPDFPERFKFLCDETPCEDAQELENSLRESGALKSRIFVRGALTDALADRLLRMGFTGTLTVSDASRVLLGRESFERLTSRGAAVNVLHETRVAAVTVNPVSAYGWHFDAAAFEEAVRARVGVPVINVNRGLK